MAKRGTPATSAQREAGLDNLSKAHRNRREQAKTADGVKAKDRWAMLLSGTITMRDLDDKEVHKMKVRNKDGSFTGRKPAMPSHIYQQFQAEQLRRFDVKMRKALKEVPGVIADILLDPEAKHSDRLRAAQMLSDRILGKSPETVRIEGVSGFDRMMSDAVGLDRESLSDEAEEFLKDQA